MFKYSLEKDEDEDRGVLMSPKNEAAKRKMYSIIRDSIISPGKAREEFSLVSPQRRLNECNYLKLSENPEVVR